MAVGQVERGYTVVMQVLGELVYVRELGQGEVLGVVGEGGQAVGGVLEQHGHWMGEETTGLS